jgi:GNAT superfamily N-acetyltransferase
VVLRSIDPLEIKNFDPSWFPLSLEYFQPNYGGLYESSACVWLQAVSDDDQPPVVGLMCLMPDRVLPRSCHIGVFEVRSDLKRLGVGTWMMETLISLLKPPDTLSVTLYVREPELVAFYSRFGFKRSPREKSIIFMRKYLTK